MPRLRIAVLLLTVFLLAACAKRAAVAPGKAPFPEAPFPEAEYSNAISEAARQFDEAHLASWRRAAQLYERAYRLRPTETLKDRLLLSLFLVLTREHDERIYRVVTGQQMRSICAEAGSARQRALCRMAEGYIEGLSLTHWEKRQAAREIPDESLFFPETSALEAYLYLTYLHFGGAEIYWSLHGHFSRKFGDSPLFVYLNLSRPANRPAGFDTKFPDFAEIHAFVASELFYSAKYTSARSRYRRAVELIPDYTRALEGLGNIQFFALQDYPGALGYYEAALQWDPADPIALFGKGAALHELDRHAESNAVLERLLADDRLGRRLSRNEADYYQGQALYYQAFNFHVLGRADAARASIDLARLRLPNSDGILYLSGVLYFERNELEYAERDFLAALANGSSQCHAHYYLGRIKHEKKDLEFIDYVLSTCHCFQSSLKNMARHIQSVDSLDVEPAEREVFREMLKQRLEAFRAASIVSVKDLIRVIEASDIDRKEFYIDLISGVLTQIESAAGSGQ